MERPLYILALIGVRSKEVALSLGQILREIDRAETIKVRQRRAKA
jgi:hypothetical protein